jgi:hypothetical protein
MIRENWLNWHGASTDKILEQVKHDFEDLFNPSTSISISKATGSSLNHLHLWLNHGNSQRAKRDFVSLDLDLR